MKGDVGISLYEESEQEVAYTQAGAIPTSLFLHKFMYTKFSSL